MKKIHRFAFFLFSLLMQSSLFSVINVATEAQLVSAINTANAAPDTINFTAAVTLTGPLPAITNTYAITGGGFSLDGSGAHRGFIVLNGGNPTISNLTIQNVVAQGGVGGNAGADNGGSGGGGLGAGAALFVGNGGQATLSSVSMNTCTATGGNSLDPAILPNGSSGGGAGGGLGGDGGNGAATGGGGGGGGILEGDDGNSSAGVLGGLGVGGGGNGGDRNPAANATAGTYGGGGGGAGDALLPVGSLSAAGGFGGGGGGGADANNSRPGSNGGFGGGGGGGAIISGTGGGSVFGGGSGANGSPTVGGQGGGGAGLGGAVFVDPTSSLTIITAVNPFAATLVTGGSGANPGSALGSDVFLASGGTLNFNITAGTVLLTNPIEADTLLATGGLTKSGVGTLNLASLANTYRGTTTVSAGILRVAADAALGNASTTVTLSGGTLQADASFTSSRSVSITAASSISATPLATNLILSGVVSGAGSLTKIGAGILTLTNAGNSYGGGTDISAGTLQVSADGNLGSGNLTLSGGILEATSTFASAKTVNITAASSISATPLATTLTLSGVVSGAGSLTKIGSGTLTLTNALNSYAGGTDISAGTLQVSADGNLGSGNLTLSGGILEATSTFASAKTVNITAASSISAAPLATTLTLNGIVSGAGLLTKIGSGTLTLTNALNSYGGGTDISAGTLQVSADGNLGSGNLTLSGGILEASGTFATGKNISLNSAASSICVSGGNTLTVNGALSGGGGLTKNCTGILALSSGLNNYTPFTTINAGILQLVGGGVLGATTPLTIVGGSFEILAGPKIIGTLTGAGNGINLNSFNLQIPNGTFSGPIVGVGGSIEKISAGTLTLSGASSYTGGTTLTAGTLSINNPASLGAATSVLTMNAGTLNPIASFTSSRPITINGGAINTPAGVNYNLGGVVSGIAPLSKTGDGTLSISGAANPYSGTTTVFAGDLFLDGGIFGPVTINSGARLIGNGTVGEVNNSGTISPGASIGAINVSGNLNLSPTSILDIEINQFGSSDVLLLVGGTANLDGTLNAIPLNIPINVFPKGLEYTIISAAFVNNNFATLTGTPPFQYFIRIDGGDVILFLEENVVLINLDAIEKGNPRSVAKYLASCKDPDGCLFDVLLALEQLEGKALNDALNQLCPARFGALSLVNYQSDSAVARIFGDHLKKLYRCKTKIGACQDDTKTFCFKKNNWSIWGEPFLNFSHHDKTEQQRSFHNETYGGILGTDYSFANNICVGGGGGYSYANMDWGQNLGQGLIHSIYGGIYSSYFNKQAFINLSVIGTRNFYHVGRRIHFPGYDRTGHHDHKGWDLTTHLGGGLEFPLGETLHFQPTLDIDYINVFQGKFQERNLKCIDLVVHRKQSGLLRSALVLNFMNDFQTSHICYSPGILGGWVHEAYLSSANYKANMTSKCPQDSSFIVKTFHKDQDYRLLGVSLTAIHDKGFVVTINYHAEFNHLYTKHEGRGRFEWNF